MKYLRSNEKGFTLVEVIVVVVIVAALAAVAVGVYVNYTKSARESAAQNSGGAIASFCGACKNSDGGLTDNSVSTGGGNLGCDANGGTSIEIPKDIIITISGDTVSAQHVDGDSTWTMAF
jgi:type IV pilus assembly protein PilA